MPTDPLAPLLAADGIELAHVGPEQLAALGSRVSTEPAQEFILAGARMPGLWDEQERPADYFEIHDRDWWIDVRSPASREHLRSLVVAAALADALRLEHTLLWIATVLPAMLTVETATVDDDGVHLTLRRHPDPTLPADLAEEIHPQDFADFATVLANAATVVPLPAGGDLTFTDDHPTFTDDHPGGGAR